MSCTSLGLTRPRPTQRRMISSLFLLLVLMMCIPISTIIATEVYADGSGCSTDCGEVNVAPGKYDQKLGVDFPRFGAVKLSYPNSTVLTSSIGDLLFTVTLIPPESDRTIQGIPEASFYSSVDIYIPPDFMGLSISKVWSSFTNDYDPNSLSLSRLPSTDRIGPNWWRASVKNLILTSDLDFVDSNSSLTALRVFVANQSQYVRLFQITSPSTAGRYFFKIFINGTSVGASDYPTIVVKGSKDPAYISGTLRDIGDTDPDMAGKPLVLPDGYGARVVATGVDYLGNPSAAQAFINSTAHGQYTLFGVAPGTYNITAYAAGFLPRTLPMRVNVIAAQSLEGIDIFLPHSANVTGTVRSLTADGVDIPWGQLYGFGGAVNRSIIVRILSHDGTVLASTPAPYRPAMFTDPDATSFEFSIYREVDYDGRIPQDFANYTSGLTASDYFLRAYVTSYVQFDDSIIHVSNETKRIYSTVRLIRSGFFSVTVHFKDYNSTLTGTPTSISGTLTVEAYDQEGIRRGSNATFVPQGSTEATLEILGLSESRSFGFTELLPPNYGLMSGTYHIHARFTSSPSFTGFANVGIRELYYQLNDLEATIGLATVASFNTPTQVSLPMIRGGGIIVTLYSVDEQSPALPRPWAFPSSTIMFQIVDSVGNIYQANATQPSGSTDLQIFYSGLLTDDYSILVRTLGYKQREILRVHVTLGGNSDASIWMVQEPLIDLTLVFTTEGIFSPIDSTQPYAMPLNHLDSTPVRFEVYDALGNFVGANATHIPNETDGLQTTTFRTILAGFDRYYGNPMQAWEGFYDATDASRQGAGGLLPGSYLILVWVEGYFQGEQVHVTLKPRANASLILSMERASRISGIVVGADLYEQARPQSWVIIDMEPSNFTTFSLDGFYQIWVPGGSYMLGYSLAGYPTQSMSLYVASGSDLRVDLWLGYAQEVSEFSNPVLPSIAVSITSVGVFVRLHGHRGGSKSKNRACEN